MRRKTNRWVFVEFGVSIGVTLKNKFQVGGGDVYLCLKISIVLEVIV